VAGVKSRAEKIASHENLTAKEGVVRAKGGKKKNECSMVPDFESAMRREWHSWRHSRFFPPHTIPPGLAHIDAAIVVANDCIAILFRIAEQNG